MIFSGKIKNLAQKLQKGTLLALVSIFFIFPVSGLFADEADLPVIIPNDELLTPIELKDGLVFEVVVSEATELAVNESSVGETQSGGFLKSSDLSDSQSSILFVKAGVEKFPSSRSKFFSETDQERDNKIDFVFEGALGYSCVKSIANPGLFSFLGICLSRSELPSKNFLTPCENSLLKSMTQRSANDWKFLWRPVRTTSLWPLSTSSSRIQRISILKPSLSHTHSMSDTSSTWSNEMAVFPATFSLEKRTGLPQIVLLAPNHLQRSQLAPNQRVEHPNPQLL